MSAGEGLGKVKPTGSVYGAEPSSSIRTGRTKQHGGVGVNQLLGMGTGRVLPAAAPPKDNQPRCTMAVLGTQAHTAPRAIKAGWGKGRHWGGPGQKVGGQGKGSWGTGRQLWGLHAQLGNKNNQEKAVCTGSWALPSSHPPPLRHRIGVVGAGRQAGRHAATLECPICTHLGRLGVPAQSWGSNRTGNKQAATRGGGIHPPPPRSGQHGRWGWGRAGLGWGENKAAARNQMGVGSWDKAHNQVPLGTCPEELSVPTPVKAC